MNPKYKTAEINNRKLLALRPLASETLKSLRDYYRVGLTYSSNALEGNSLTESETKVVIEDGLTIEGKPLRDVYEAVGHAKAYDYLYQLATHKTAGRKKIFWNFTACSISKSTLVRPGNTGQCRYLLAEVSIR